MNGGVAAYKWSVDGVNWYDVDASSTFGDGEQGINTAVDKENAGLKDINHNLRYSINIGGLLELPAGSYDVYLGAIPTNNPEVVVHVMTIKNFCVPETSE